MLMRTLLPARRERPCGSCATEKRDELTTLHVLPSVEDHTLPHYQPALCITAKMAVDVSSLRIRRDVPMSEVRMIYILAAVDPGDYPYEGLAAVDVPS